MFNLNCHSEKVVFLSVSLLLALYLSLHLSFLAFTMSNQRLILIGSESRCWLMRSEWLVGKEKTGGGGAMQLQAPLFLPAVGFR